MSLGSSPMTTSIAAPARNPVTTARDRKLASQPSLRMATRRNRAPVAIAIAATSWAASLPVEAGHQDRAAGDGRERRARAGRDVAGRAEDRVDDRRGRGRVQPVLHRDAGDARVAEVLGHDHRRDRDARDHVAAEPPAVVAFATSRGSGRTVSIDARGSSATQRASGKCPTSATGPERTGALRGKASRVRTGIVNRAVRRRDNACPRVRRCGPGGMPSRRRDT